MKLLAVTVSLSFCSAFCSEVALGESKRVMALNEDSRLNILLTDPSRVDVDMLASSGSNLDEFSLNEAMKRMGEDVCVCDKAHLLNENKIIMSKPYEELVDYAMGYGLTWLLRSLLFRYDGWKSEFDRHVYAAQLYEKGWCPLEEWQDQEGLNWDVNYQAIFKADSPKLLHDMFSNPGVIFQEGRPSNSWVRPTEGSVEFIKKHFHRLIIHHDSVRILEATNIFQSTSTPLLPSLFDGNLRNLVKISVFENNNGDPHVTGSNWKLRSLSDLLFKGESLVPNLSHQLFEHRPTYDHIEHDVRHATFVLLEDDIVLRIFRYDYDWAMEMLYQRKLLSTSIETIDIIEKAINSGSHKILAWIYDRVHESFQSLEEKFEVWAVNCPPMQLSDILKVHKSHFPKYRPTQSFINDHAKDARILDFLGTFEPPLHPQKESVDHWDDLNMILQVYEANPNWSVSEEVFRRAASECVTTLVNRGLKDHQAKKVGNACSLQLIQHNAMVDGNYVPSGNELREAVARDGVALASWLHEQDRFRGLLDRHVGLFSQNIDKDFQLIKWLWDNKKIKPSIMTLQRLFEGDDVKACEWAWGEFRNEIVKLDEQKVIIVEKGIIQWWIRNFNENYIPNIYKAFEKCVKDCDVNSARWLVESWPFGLEKTEKLPEYIWECENETVIDFLEMIYVSNVSLFLQEPMMTSLMFLQPKHQNIISMPTLLPSRLSKMLDKTRRPLLRGYLWEMRNRPNLTRILAEHLRLPISVDEWVFILGLPRLYGKIELKTLTRLVLDGDIQVLIMLYSRGYLRDHMKMIEGMAKEKGRIVIMEWARSLQR